jgi:PAS domain S-box-containing protein/putative nucleotidyltransferase with HDIG domain
MRHSTKSNKTGSPSRFWKNFIGVRLGLIRLVLYAIMPVFALIIYNASAQRQYATNQAQAQAQQIAQITSANQQRIIEGAKQLLVTLAQLPQVQEDNAQTCNLLLADIRQQIPSYNNIGLIGSDGWIKCSASPLTQPIYEGDRSYFQHVIESKDFAIGEYQIDRITGKPAIDCGYPVLDDHEQVKAVVYVALDLSWLNQIATEVHLPQGTSMLVIDQRGTILSHYPNPEQWVGKAVPDASIVKTILSGHQGTIETSGLEGTPQLYAFTTLGSNAPYQSIYVGVGIPTATIYAESNHLLIQNLLALGVLGLLSLVFALTGANLFVIKRVTPLVNAAKHLTHGDLKARTRQDQNYDADEVGQVALALDQLGEALEQRQAEVEQAVEALQQREEYFRSLIENASDLISVMDLNGVVVYQSPSIQKILGLEPEKVVGVSIYDFTHPDDINRFKRAISQATDHPDESVTLEVRLQHEDRSWRVLDVIVKFLKSEGGQSGSVINGRDITERKQAEERVKRQLEQMQALHEIDTAINASLDINTTLNLILDQVIKQLGVDAACILLLNPHLQTLDYAAGRGFRDSAITHSSIRVGEGIAGNAALEHRLVQIPNLKSAVDRYTRSGLLIMEDFQAYCAAPLISKGEVKGILEIYQRGKLDFNPDWISFLDMLATQTAIATDNATLFSDLQRANANLRLAYDATIEGWSRTLDLRDEETEGHTRRVTEMTIQIAKAMGISNPELVHIRRGALLHDIGKMGIPDKFLLKPKSLTEKEWVIMRKHPTYAYELLRSVPFLQPALDIPYCHHEKWDGSGYPRGLKGEQIPLSARIFAVADVWDALSSERPYRKGWPQNRVLEFIQEQSGKHFDPQVVEVFMRLVNKVDLNSSWP